MDVVTVRDVTKTYRLGVGRARVREMLPPPIDGVVSRLLPGWWNRNTFHALEDVSLSVAAGSSLGIVGANGAGKTTLLKVIAGVTEPTRGEIAVRGRVAALIDLLVGFHPDLTGRENIEFFGALHGIGRRTMANRAPGILEFAEIEDLADTPLKRYSAGMGARLGFGVLTALDVDVIVVDEVLTVGDGDFQRRCVQWLQGFRAGGGTLLFVSHNLALVRDMTERVLWMRDGRVADDGPAGKVVAEYMRELESHDPQRLGFGTGPAWRRIRAGGTRRWGIGGASIKGVRFNEHNGNGAPLELTIAYEASLDDQAVFLVGFSDDSGREVGGAASTPRSLNLPRGEIRCEVASLPLRSGTYFPTVAILSSDGRVRDRWKLDRAIVVDRNGEAEAPDTFGPLAIRATWSGR